MRESQGNGPGSSVAVRDAVGRRIVGVYSGKVDPRSRAGLAPRPHLQMRAIEATELERMARRLTKMEKQLAEFRLKAEQGSAQHGTRIRREVSQDIEFIQQSADGSTPRPVLLGRLRNLGLVRRLIVCIYLCICQWHIHIQKRKYAAQSQDLHE